MTAAYPQQFSEDLEKWLHSHQDKTLRGLIAVFAEKSFALLFMLLMALPALPVPTGGVTHVTEIITALISLQLIGGRQTIWLPKRWQKLDLGRHLSGKAIPSLLRIIRWFERFSRHRGARVLARRWPRAGLGLIILIFTAAAFVAPPFSGLDTLPALGVVIISLALILEDMLIVLGGVIVGLGGIALEIAAGTALYEGILHFF